LSLWKLPFLGRYPRLGYFPIFSTTTPTTQVRLHSRLSAH